ncbi:MAG: sporulation protein YunB [Clostridia bacterium]|nr:sporulation protein YunB [Clostridia bacterium]
MKRCRNKPKQAAQRRRLAGLCLTLAGILAVLFWFVGQVEPLLVRLAQNKAQSVTLKIIHDRVGEWLASEEITYDSLVQFGYNPDGELIYLETDMVKLNTLKAHVGSRIQQSFDQHDFGAISIPLGTLLGGDLLVGRGPSLRFPVEMSCSVQCTFTNLFDDAGINQTRHQILLEITGTTLAVADWCKTSTKVTTNFIVAETILVGKVPEYFTDVEHSADALQDINDYGYDIN